MIMPWELRRPQADPLKYSKIIGGLGLAAGGLASGIASARGVSPSRLMALKRILTGTLKGVGIGAVQGAGAGAVADLARQAHG
jgi:hypothetical protein